MSTIDPHDLPTGYARDWRGAAQRALHNHGPAIRALQDTGLLAGVPVELLAAFICAGSATSNTTDATAGKGLEVAFHEVGLWQVPAGPADRDPVTKHPRAPAPTVNPGAPNNTWGRLAHDGQVVAALGRSAPMTADGWKHDVAAQHAVGLAMLRDDYRAAAGKLPPAIAPASWATPWGCVVTFTAFSAGPGAAAALFTRYAWQLEAAPDAVRWRVLIRAVAQDLAGGWQPGGSPDHHSNAVHRVLRTWQKLELARAIAAPERVACFDAGFGADQDLYERVILRGNWGAPQTAEDLAALAAAG